MPWKVEVLEVWNLRKFKGHINPRDTADVWAAMHQRARRVKWPRDWNE